MHTPEGEEIPSSPPRRKLPVNPSLEHLQKQAKRRAKQSPSLKLATAQHQLAREYGCKNWAELARMVETMSRGAEYLAYAPDQSEPLPKAARRMDFDTVRAILGGGDFTQHDLDQGLAHALWYVGENSWTQAKAMADLLLGHGADPDGQYGGNYGPIVFGTAECLQPESLQYLIEAGADVTLPPVATKYGTVSLAAHALGTYNRGRNERKHRFIDILLREGAWFPPEITPPMLAIHRGDARQLGDLLEGDPGLLTRRFPDMPYGNIELRGATLLHCAVEFGEIECLDELFRRQADINLTAEVIDGIGGQTPIFHAINTNADSNFHLLEYLIDRVGPWIDMSVRATWRSFGKSVIQPMTPLEYALSAAHEESRKWRKRIDEELVLLRGLDHTAQIKTAILRHDTDTVKRLLHEHPGLLTPALWPPALFEARSLEITRLLLDRGLSPDECSAPRKPLHLAVYQGLPEIVELLIARGADVNLRNELGETPLWFAAHSPAPSADRIAVMQLLLEAGADLHRRCEDGSTALHLAAWRGPVETVEYLLSRGGRSWMTDHKEQTPLDYARRSESPDKEAIVRLFSEVRILDPLFRAAVEAIDSGEVDKLRELLQKNPGLVRQRAEEEGWFAGNYFRHPTLLHFVANNPYRHQTMPPRILESTEAILDAGADINAATETGEENDHGVLGLVTSCEPARKDGLQIPLIELLVRRGANSTLGLDPATAGIPSWRNSSAPFTDSDVRAGRSS